MTWKWEILNIRSMNAIKVKQQTGKLRQSSHVPVLPRNGIGWVSGNGKWVRPRYNFTENWARNFPSTVTPCAGIIVPPSLVCVFLSKAARGSFHLLAQNALRSWEDTRAVSSRLPTEHPRTPSPEMCERGRTFKEQNHPTSVCINAAFPSKATQVCVSFVITWEAALDTASKLPTPHNNTGCAGQAEVATH